MIKITEKKLADEKESSIIIDVKAVPGASRTQFMGEYNEALKIAVQAPPEKGKANEMLIKFLAKALGISKQNIKIISGETNQLKKIQIIGIEKECFLQIINS